MDDQENTGIEHPPSMAGADSGWLFRQIVETADQGIWLVNAEGRTDYVNHRLTEILGRPAEDILGRPYHEFVDPAERAMAAERWESAKEGRRRRFERRFVRPDGSLVWVLLSVSPRLDEHGRLAGVLTMVTDITERKRWEDRLAANEAHFRYLFERNPHPMWVYDEATLRYLEVNEAAIALYGYSREEFLQMTLLDIRSPTEAERVRRLLPSFPRSGFYEGGVWEHRRKDGRLLHMEVVSNDMQYDGRLAIIVSARDVSERLRAEAALKESEGRFRHMADSVPGILWVTDSEGRFTFLSRTFEEYTGRSAEQYYGKTSTGTAHPDDQPAHSRYETAMRERRRIAYEYRVRRHDGKYRWFLDTCVPRFDGETRFLGYIGMLIDIEDERSLTEQLHQSQKIEAVGQLTGGVAHDFNNLLTVILGNAELLSERLSDPDLKMLADATQSAAERSATLVQRLLAFSRRQALQPTPTDVGQLLAGMRDLLNRTLGEDIDISLRCQPGVPQALIDRSQLESAILNLAINARDAMQDGGHLTIECAAARIDEAYAAAETEVVPGDYVMVAISDTGSGMTAQVKQQAFEPFFTTKGPGRGTGLGLSTVYGFIKQSGGHVKLYSELGHGTSVKLYLRRAPGDAPASPAPQGVDAPPTGGSELILVVEDDDQVRDYVASQLRELGYGIVEAANGAAALSVIDRTPEIALLFTDVVMPGGMNGRELADAASIRRPGLKVLFTSGYTEDAIVHHGRLDPGVELLGKPYSRRELARKVRSVLDGGR